MKDWQIDRLTGPISDLLKFIFVGHPHRFHVVLQVVVLCVQRVDHLFMWNIQGMNYHIADELETLVSCAIFLLSLYIMSAEMVCCCC